MKRWWEIRRELSLGAPAPFWWRQAWYEPRRRIGVYFPTPLHWFARGLRELRYRVWLAWSAPARDVQEYRDVQRVHLERVRLAEEFAEGYLNGWRECFEVCKAAMEEEVERARWN